VRDFTVAAYLTILEAADKAGYRTFALADWLEATHPQAMAEPALVLRHDVDRRPANALAMAQAEAARGVRSTYYFRIVPAAFDRDIVRAIAGLGHEIGYHYEDFHLARYDAKKAIVLFAQHLAELRAIAPVSTIAMHGSPLARHNNMKLWETEQFEPYGVKDCILSNDWREFVFFTDTGRTFGQTTANLRDTIGGQSAPGVASSADVADYLTARRHRLVQLSTHPERWSDQKLDWIRQIVTDSAANVAKRLLVAVRGRAG
jgi:hypothetical protein